MDLKRLACKTGPGDGPDAKRATTADDEPLHVDQESGVDKETSDAQTECVQLDDVNKAVECNSFKAGNENLSASSHVAPYTGNGCAPSLESFMFEQTPAGSQLCSWMSNTESKTSANDVPTLFESEKDPKPNAQTKFNRKALTKLRRLNALRALELERELATNTSQASTLLLRFPDPKISVSSVSEFSKSIRNVIFPTNISQRYCLVHLKAGANVELTIEEIKQVRFGHGRLHAELKIFTDEEQADSIDPCTLYVSNIPFNMNAADIKGFVNSMRVDIGVMQRQKRARYAFVRYANAEMAMEAFRDLVRRPLNNRKLTVRYRRLRNRYVQPTAESMCAISNLSIDTIATDDDGIECRVISPPPVESITIMDSDDEPHCESQSIISPSSNMHKKRQKTMTAQEKEIQRLKLQVAEHGAIIRSLQKREGSVNAITKGEQHSDLSTDKSSLMHGSLSPCSSYDIKMENDYLGIAQSTPEPEQDSLPENITNLPYRDTTCPIDGVEDPIKSSDCFGWLISGLGRRKSTRSSAQQPIKENSTKKTPIALNLAVLHAQVEADLEA